MLVILDRTNLDENDFHDGVSSAQWVGTVVTVPVAPVEVPVCLRIEMSTCKVHSTGGCICLS